MVDAEIRERIQSILHQEGEEPRFLLRTMGTVEWPGSEHFFDNDSVLAVTDTAFIIYKTAVKGVISKRVEVSRVTRFEFREMSDLEFSGEAPRKIRFKHDPQVVNLLDIFAEEEWDDMVRFWGEQVLGGPSQDTAAPAPGGPAWQRLRAHIIENNPVQEVDDNTLKMILDLPENRTQVLLVSRDALLEGTEDWIVVRSPVGEHSRVNLVELMAEAGRMVVGGLAIEGELVVLRSSHRAASTDTEELDRVIRLVGATADRLESTFVGGDTY